MSKNKHVSDKGRAPDDTINKEGKKKRKKKNDE